MWKTFIETAWEGIRTSWAYPFVCAILVLLFKKIWDAVANPAIKKNNRKSPIIHFPVYNIHDVANMTPCQLSTYSHHFRCKIENGNEDTDSFCNLGLTFTSGNKELFTLPLFEDNGQLITIVDVDKTYIELNGNTSLSHCLDNKGILKPMVKAEMVKLLDAAHVYLTGQQKYNKHFKIEIPFDLQSRIAQLKMRERLEQWPAYAARPPMVFQRNDDDHDPAMG